MLFLFFFISVANTKAFFLIKFDCFFYIFSFVPYKSPLLFIRLYFFNGMIQIQSIEKFESAVKCLLIALVKCSSLTEFAFVFSLRANLLDMNLFRVVFLLFLTTNRNVYFALIFLCNLKLNKSLCVRMCLCVKLWIFPKNKRHFLLINNELACDGPSIKDLYNLVLSIDFVGISYYLKSLISMSNIRLLKIAAHCKFQMTNNNGFALKHKLFNPK